MHISYRKHYFLKQCITDIFPPYRWYSVTPEESYILICIMPQYCRKTDVTSGIKSLQGMHWDNQWFGQRQVRFLPFPFKKRNPKPHVFKNCLLYLPNQHRKANLYIYTYIYLYIYIPSIYLGKTIFLTSPQIYDNPILYDK